MDEASLKRNIIAVWAENLRALGVTEVVLEGFKFKAGGVEGVERKEAEPGRNKVSREELLKAEAEVVSRCTRCPLAAGRTHTVYGDGSAYAEIVIVGEAPGAEEDRQGLPFVGRAGQLLNKLLEKVGLRRSDLYICNVVKCRPPENREPTIEEITACKPYLEKQLNIIKPKIICCLGLPAARTILNTRDSMSKMRGKPYRLNTTVVVPTYHTAAATRFPSLKQYIYEDLCLVRDLAYG